MGVGLLFFLREGEGREMGYTLVTEGSETVESNKELQFKVGSNCVVDWDSTLPCGYAFAVKPKEYAVCWVIPLLGNTNEGGRYCFLSLSPKKSMPLSDKLSAVGVLDGPDLERSHMFYKQEQQTYGTAYIISYRCDGFSKSRLIFVLYTANIS